MRACLPVLLAIAVILLLSGPAPAYGGTTEGAHPGTGGSPSETFDAPSETPVATPENAGVTPPSAPVMKISIPSSSGGLAGVYRPSLHGKGKAILLIGANGYPVNSLDGLAETLRQTGYSVLSIENPGIVQGRVDTAGLPRLNPHSNRNSSIERLVNDVNQGIVFLDGEPTADMSSIALAGVGLGGNLAAFLAGRDARVSAIAFLSPGSSCSPEQTMRSVQSVGETPALLVEKPTDEGFRPAFEATGHGGRTIVDFETTEIDPYAALGSDSFPTRTIVSWLIERYPPGKP